MKIIKTEKYNSNNAWGFGGKAGKYIYYDNGIIVFDGRNHHRHSGTSSANQVYILATDDFMIPVRSLKKLPASGSVISVYVHDDHYAAIVSDEESTIEYGKIHNRIKRIVI